jgi:hypothetical protein
LIPTESLAGSAGTPTFSSLDGPLEPISACWLSVYPYGILSTSLRLIKGTSPFISRLPKLAPRHVSAATASSRNSLLVQSLTPVAVPRLSVPWSRSAVGRFLGYPVFPQRVAPTTLSSQCILSSSSAFLQSLAQRHLASQPQPTGSSLGLSFPSAHEGSEVHSPRALPARYVPPAGFGYPLGGLRPPSPCRFCFTPAALLGFALRSFLLSQGTHRVSAGVDPHAVSPVGFPAAEAVGRPNGPRLLGFDPCASTWRPDEG